MFPPMHDDTAKAIDKVRKLLALAAGAGTPEEAAAAFANAQRVAARAALTEEQVRLASLPSYAAAGRNVPTVARLVHVAEGSVATWRALLCGHLAKANGCSYVVYNGRNTAADGTYQAVKGLKVWGRETDLDIVAVMLDTIGGQIDALAKRAGVRGRTGLNNFRLGAVQVIGERVAKAAAEARKALEAEVLMDQPGGCTALAVRNLDNRVALAEAQRKADIGPITRRRTSSRVDDYAREAGRRAGAVIGLSPSKALR